MKAGRFKATQLSKVEVANCSNDFKLIFEDESVFKSRFKAN